MKISKILTVAVIGAAVAACNPNYYDDHNFPGYHEGISDVKNIEYTLEDADYASIAKNATNKTIAEAAGVSDELAALPKTMAFSETLPAGEYLPAFLSSTWATADNGSVAVISFNQATAFAPEVASVAAAGKYVLTADDYKAVWGSDTDYTEALTPATISKLSKQVPTEGLQSGDFIFAQYNYSDTEPQFGDSPAPEVEYTQVLGTAALNAEVEVVAYVSALSAQGPVITDKTGSVLLYKGSSDLALGQAVKVTGTISAYNKGFQIAAASATVETLSEVKTVEYPIPADLSAADIEAVVKNTTDNAYARFVKFEGTTTVSGNYYNIALGVDPVQGSVYGATDAVKAALKNGEKQTFYGYFTSISSGKYFNVIIVSVDEAPKFKYTALLGNAKLGDNVEVKGLVTAVSAQGPIVSDAGGSVLLYGKGLSLALGDEVSVTGAIASYNKGFQIAASSATIEKTGEAAVSYPVAHQLTGAEMDEILTTRTENEYAKYVSVTGTMAVSGNYYNFTVEGAQTAQGSIYGITDELKTKIENGQVYTIEGYFITVSSSRYINIIVTDLKTATAPVSLLSVKVPSRKQYAAFTFDGSKLSKAPVEIVQPEDVAAMSGGAEYLSTPDKYMPKYLSLHYPYVEEGESVIIAYPVSTGFAADQYNFNGTEWVKYNAKDVKKAQFRMDNGAWKEDKTLELNYSEMGTAEFKAFCQYCCNWVFDFKDVALMGCNPRDNAGEIISTVGVQQGGAQPTSYYYVSNYGNNEWYAGTYAYYGEINWSASKAKAACDEYAEMSDEDVVSLMQVRCGEVFAGVLSYMYPDVTPETYAKVVIKVYDYVSRGVFSYTFAVTGTAQFEWDGEIVEE